LGSYLDDVISVGELMLHCAVLQSTLVQEVDVHPLNQDKRAQISASQRKTYNNLNTTN